MGLIRSRSRFVGSAGAILRRRQTEQPAGLSCLHDPQPHRLEELCRAVDVRPMRLPAPALGFPCPQLILYGQLPLKTLEIPLNAFQALLNVLQEVGLGPRLICSWQAGQCLPGLGRRPLGPEPLDLLVGSPDQVLDLFVSRLRRLVHKPIVDACW